MSILEERHIIERHIIEKHVGERILAAGGKKLFTRRESRVKIEKQERSFLLRRQAAGNIKNKEYCMRGIYTNVVEIRQKIFTEVARLAYEGGDYSRIINLPYTIIPGEVATYRESVFLERAIVEERLRLAIGLSLRKMTEHAPVSQGIEESAIAEKYYDPPLVNIIKFACHACPDNEVRVTDSWSWAVLRIPVRRCVRKMLFLL